MTTPAVEQAGPGDTGTAILDHFMGAGAREVESLLAAADSDPSDGAGDTPPTPDAPPAPPLDDTPPDPATATPGDTPADDSAPAANSTTSALAESPPDPWDVLAKDATDFTFQRNGQAEVFPGIKSLGDGKGALVTPEAVPELRNLIARYESHTAANKQLYEQVQTFERAGGLQKLHELAEKNASYNAAGLVLWQALNNPTALLMQDAQGRIVPDPQAIELLRRQADVATKEAVYQARTERSLADQQYLTQRAESQTLDSAIPHAIDRTFTAQNGFPGLTAEDLTEAKQEFAAFSSSLRFKADADQARQLGVAPGQWLVDVEKMRPWFARRSQQRQQEAAAKVATEKAARENRARQTAAPPKPIPSTLPPRKPNGEFTKAGKVPEGKRKLSHSEVMREMRMGREVPEDLLVDA